MEQSRNKTAGSASVHMGPGSASLILIFVMLALSILAMLTLINARNDEHVSRRSAEVAEAIYELEAETRRIYGQVLSCCRSGRESGGMDAALIAEQVNEKNGGKVLLEADGDLISWVSTDGERSFSCTVRIQEDAGAPLQWVNHRMSTQAGWTEDEWNF